MSVLLSIFFFITCYVKDVLVYQLKNGSLGQLFLKAGQLQFLGVTMFFPWL